MVNPHPYRMERSYTYAGNNNSAAIQAVAKTADEAVAGKSIQRRLELPVVRLPPSFLALLLPLKCQMRT